MEGKIPEKRNELIADGLGGAMRKRRNQFKPHKKR